MTVDPGGRFIISPQGDEPMLRVTVPPDGSLARIEKIAAPVTSAMGLLFAFDSLYVNGMGPQGFGLYRLRDTKGADAFDEVKLLRAFEGEVSKEHGSHGLGLGPDGRIYLAQGNHVAPPSDVSPRSPFKNYAEDQLLPSANYGVSSGDKAQAPCGHILRMDADGRAVEIFAGGFRNIYDIAFDARGELDKLGSTIKNGGIMSSALVAEGAVFFADTVGWVYGLDPKTGAVIWKYDVGGKPREFDQHGPRDRTVASRASQVFRHHRHAREARSLGARRHRRQRHRDWKWCRVFHRRGQREARRARHRDRQIIARNRNRPRVLRAVAVARSCVCRRRQHGLGQRAEGHD